jgi:hypothetical protein
MSGNILSTLPSVILMFSLLFYVALIGAVIIYFYKLYKVHLSIDKKLGQIVNSMEVKEK